MCAVLAIMHYFLCNSQIPPTYVPIADKIVLKKQFDYVIGLVLLYQVDLEESKIRGVGTDWDDSINFVLLSVYILITH